MKFRKVERTQDGVKLCTRLIHHGPSSDPISMGACIDPESDDAADGFSDISGVMPVKGCRMPMAWLPLPWGHMGMASIWGSMPGSLDAGVIQAGRAVAAHSVACEPLSLAEASTGCSHGGGILMGSHDAAVGCIQHSAGAGNDDDYCCAEWRGSAASDVCGKVELRVACDGFVENRLIVKRTWSLE